MIFSAYARNTFVTCLPSNRPQAKILGTDLDEGDLVLLEEMSYR